MLLIGLIRSFERRLKILGGPRRRLV